MVVRKMTLEDIESVYTLSTQCFSEPWSLESIKQELSNTVASYFVAEKGKAIMGYAGLWHVLDEGEVINIAVASEERRRGVGQALLEKLLEEAKVYSLSILHLEVRQSNQAAIALYEKFGFKSIAIRKGYYHKPIEDAVIMECIL